MGYTESIILDITTSKKEKPMLTINEKQEFLKTIIDLIKKYPMELSIGYSPLEYVFDIEQINNTDFVINMTHSSSFNKNNPFTQKILKYNENKHDTSIMLELEPISIMHHQLEMNYQQIQFKHYSDSNALEIYFYYEVKESKPIILTIDNKDLIERVNKPKTEENYYFMELKNKSLSDVLTILESMFIQFKIEDHARFEASGAYNRTKKQLKKKYNI